VCVDSVHARELLIEGLECQEATSHTHIVAIAGEGWEYDQCYCCSEECIATKAKIRLQAHVGNVQGIEKG
jgi:hypothetical protein